MDGAAISTAGVMLAIVLIVYFVVSIVAWFKNLFVRPPDDAIIEIKYGDYRVMKEELNRAQRNGCMLKLLALLLVIACLYFVSI